MIFNSNIRRVTSIYSFEQTNSDSDEDYGISQGIIDLTKVVQNINELWKENIMLFLKHD